MKREENEYRNLAIDILEGMSTPGHEAGAMDAVDAIINAVLAELGELPSESQQAILEHVSDGEIIPRSQLYALCGSPDRQQFERDLEWLLRHKRLSY